MSHYSLSHWAVKMVEDEGFYFNEETSDGINALNLKWMLGYNKDIVDGVHNLTETDRTEIFYSAAHSGVIYNYVTREQKLLQGHCNQISACVASSDKRWLVTADAGDDSMMVVWDSHSATPVRTVFNPHPEGISHIDISSDSKFIVTLSNSVPQMITLWDWSRDAEENSELTIASSEIKMLEDVPNLKCHCVKFNQSNPREIASNSLEHVFFWQWEDDGFGFEYYYNDRIAPKDFFLSTVADFTQTVFMSNSTQAVTGTVDGHLIVWNYSNIAENESQAEERRAIKIIELVSCAIPVLTTTEEFLVIGSSDGVVRFYDQRFTVEAWFDNLSATNIRSISFANLPPRPSGDGTEKFACPDFIISSDSAKVVEVQSTFFEEVPPMEAEEFHQGRTLMQGFAYVVTCMAVHPHKPLIAVGGGKSSKSYVYVWNYRTRERVIYPKSRTNAIKAHTAEPIAMNYSPDGKYLFISFADKEFVILDSDNITVEKQTKIHYTEHAKAITSFVFSRDSRALATIHATNHVSLFKLQHKDNNPELPMLWTFCGSHEAHFSHVNAVAFGESVNEFDSSALRLFSVSDDRYMVEYDTSSTDMTQLKVISVSQIEQECVPTCCVWYPVKTGEDLLLTANSLYKLKLWNVNDKSCRLGCLGPTYGEPLNKLRLVTKPKKNSQSAIEAPDYFLAYATSKKVVGLMKLPVDGNPNKAMGLVAHPTKVHDIRVSGDNKFLFTCGGEDLSVCMWFIDTESIDRQILLGGSGMEPYFNMIEGGREGSIYQDMKDFFYFAQIWIKAEDTTKARKLEGSVTLDDIGNLMRALGYYPTEQDIKNICNEVKYSRFTETGQAVSKLDLDQLLKVYVNHRPVSGIERDQIQQAFYSLTGTNSTITKNELLRLLMTEGEAMGDKEMLGCLTSLIGPPEPEGDYTSLLPNEITADFFIDKVLGFEEVSQSDDQLIEEQASADTSYI